MLTDLIKYNEPDMHRFSVKQLLLDDDFNYLLYSENYKIIENNFKYQYN